MEENLEFKQKQSAAILRALSSVLPGDEVYLPRNKNMLFIFSDEEAGAFYAAIDEAFDFDPVKSVVFGAKIEMAPCNTDELGVSFEDTVEAIHSNSEAMAVFSLLAELNGSCRHYKDYWDDVVSEIACMPRADRKREHVEAKVKKLEPIAKFFPKFTAEYLISGIIKHYATE
jgi:hypothetical protein